MDDERFDEFLDDATNRIADFWYANDGQDLSLEEKYQLNDLLTAFFDSKRSR